MNRQILLPLISLIVSMSACDKDEVCPENELIKLEVSARDTVIPCNGNKLIMPILPIGWSIIRLSKIEGQDTVVFNNPVSESGTYPKSLYTGYLDCVELKDHIKLWAHQNMGEKRDFILEIGGDGFQPLFIHIEQERDPMLDQEWPDPPAAL